MLSPQAPWADEFRATIGLAWPLILTNVTMVLINATDVFLLARLGPEALAASAMGSGIVIAMLLFGIGLVTAAAPMMATKIGAMPHSVRDIRRTFRQSLWAATAITIPIWILLWFSTDMLLAAGLPERLARDTGGFIRALQWLILPTLGVVALRSFMSALELPRWTLVAGLAAVVVNAAVNYGLIFGNFGLPAWGLWGAGIGSSVTSLFQFLFLVAVATLHPRFRRYHLFGRFWRADWPRFREIWRIGFPIALHLGFEASVFAAAVILMGYISTAAVAAHAVAIQIASMTFMVPMGIAQAATVRVGIGNGRGDRAAIGRSGWAAFILGVGFMAAMAAIIWIFPLQLAGIFIDPALAGNDAVLQLAASFLAIAAIFQIVDGAQVVGAGMLRGLHDTKWPMLFAAFGYWVIGIGVGAGLAFWGGWGGVGIWTGLATGLAFVAVMILIRWIRRDVMGLMPLNR
ncbi:MAG: MATE family efflux transporter [Sphingorhabdus sp.]|nr:MATE family efflux transporter [Sphingorhabdus sp.]